MLPGRVEAQTYKYKYTGTHIDPYTNWPYYGGQQYEDCSFFNGEDTWFAWIANYAPAEITGITELTSIAMAMVDWNWYIYPGPEV